MEVRSGMGTLEDMVVDMEEAAYMEEDSTEVLTGTDTEVLGGL